MQHDTTYKSHLFGQRSVGHMDSAAFCPAAVLIETDAHGAEHGEGALRSRRHQVLQSAQSGILATVKTRLAFRTSAGENAEAS